MRLEQVERWIDAAQVGVKFAKTVLTGGLSLFVAWALLDLAKGQITFPASITKSEPGEPIVEHKRDSTLRYVITRNKICAVQMAWAFYDWRDGPNMPPTRTEGERKLADFPGGLGKDQPISLSYVIPLEVKPGRVRIEHTRTYDCDWVLGLTWRTRIQVPSVFIEYHP